MWWMIAQAGMDVIGTDQKNAAMVYSDVTSYLKSKNASMTEMDNAQTAAAAIQRDKALSNVEINKSQRAAEADARVSAAHTGASGGGVDNVIRMTKTNAAYAQGASNIQMNAAFQQQIENVYSAAYTYHSTKYTPPESVLGKMIKGALTVGVNPLDGEAYADSMAFAGG